jgi:ferritin-like metal-binding protein YciE
MAAYGTARAHAEQLGYQEVASLLQKTLDEESKANELLTAIAERMVNAQAERGNGRM